MAPVSLCGYVMRAVCDVDRPVVVLNGIRVYRLMGKVEKIRALRISLATDESKGSIGK